MLLLLSAPLADTSRQRQPVRADPAHPAVVAGEQARRIVSPEQPAVQQQGKPLQEGLKGQARSLPEMVSDQSYPHGGPRRRVPLRMPMHRGQIAQAGLGPASCLILAVPPDVQPRHAEMIPVTESVPLQRAALERVKKRVVIHVHTVAHSHTVKGPQANRICRVADALSCREALAPRQELVLSPLASGERD